MKTKVEEFRPGISFDVYALDRHGSDLAYSPDVHVIAQDDPDAYRLAADRINASGVDAVWLQHEYGIFGGPDGRLVTDLIDRLAVPLVVTLHTILSTPSVGQRHVMERLLGRAGQVMVMSQHGRDLLISLYGASHERVTVVAHGAPDRPFGREEHFKASLGVANRPVLMTFGLLGPGKGIEHAIEALPAIAARHPDVLYRIVGATHPDLVRDQGERYRERLKARVAQLGLQRNVAWDDRFLDTDELLDQLEACDVYLTPYPNLQQSTSGTLSYAVALGKAVVSTRYIHACELLADGVGVLVPAEEPSAISNAVNALLNTPECLNALKMRAYAKGRSTIWQQFADASANLVEKAVARKPTSAEPVDGAGHIDGSRAATGQAFHLSRSDVARNTFQRLSPAHP
ncbi:glycosyltransferase family 4 protein (plasmid) [Novosphingobium sp. BL-8A]|uniref:glycosyltransferase family 4 protein n=1 Tax=Novosphingobium sp. BL-8A TaxID=3127639 RepID=UPI003757DAF4